MRMLIEGVSHVRAVIPAHPRDPDGEIRTKQLQDKARYPGAGW